MTQVATKTAASHTVAQTPAAVLRDAAFVLMMTKKVKDAMLNTEPRTSPKRRPRTAAGVIAA